MEAADDENEPAVAITMTIETRRDCNPLPPSLHPIPLGELSPGPVVSLRLSFPISSYTDPWPISSW